MLKAKGFEKSVLYIDKNDPNRDFFLNRYKDIVRVGNEYCLQTPYKEDENGNYVPADEAEYFDVEPLDQGTDIRREIVLGLERLDFNVEVSHHEVAAGQHEVDFKYADALKTADAVITFKEAVKAVVHNLGFKATFMPKPFLGINGSGMHCNQSLFKDGKNIFYDPNTENQISQEALYFIGGLLKGGNIPEMFLNLYSRFV